MLIVSYTTILSSSRTGVAAEIAEVAICAFGLFYTYIQRVLAKSLATRTKFIATEYLLKWDPVYSGAMRARVMPLKNVQSDWIPGALAVLWAVLLAVALMGSTK